MRPEEYAKLADVEDRIWYFRALHENIRRGLARRVGDKAALLDAGCGTGGLIRRLGEAGRKWTWTGVDASAIALEAARTRGGPGRFVSGSLTALPFEAGVFDAVVSADVLYAIKDDATALREFARVLKPGGTLVLNVPALPWLWSYHDVAVGSVRRYVSRDLRSKLTAAGLRPELVTYTGMLTLPFVIVRRKLLPAPKSGSDVHLLPAPAEAFFALLMAVERAGLKCGLRFPIGSSLFAVASTTAPRQAN